MFTFLHPLYKKGFIKMLENIHIKDPYTVYMKYILSAGMMTTIDQRNMIVPTDKKLESTKKIII